MKEIQQAHREISRFDILEAKILTLQDKVKKLEVKIEELSGGLK